jgi:hypothetical protein
MSFFVVFKINYLTAQKYGRHRFIHYLLRKDEKGFAENIPRVRAFLHYTSFYSTLFFTRCRERVNWAVIYVGKEREVTQ